jgi:hypothetical protein
MFPVAPELSRMIELNEIEHQGNSLVKPETLLIF